METLQLTIENRIASVLLNRPKALNSFNQAMHDDFRRALDAVARSDARVLLIRGGGRAFCAGQDLSERQARPDEDGVDLGQSLEANYNPLIRRLMRLDLPLVCAVNGVAAGAGASLALCADIMIMREGASLALAFARIGLVPDSGCSWLLTRAIGQRRAKALALLGGTISAAQAREWGLAYAVYDDAEFESQTQKMCETLAQMPPRALAYTKRLFRAAAQNDLDAQLDEERDYQRLAGRTHDYREGVSAFLAKRPPQFRGE